MKERKWFGLFHRHTWSRWSKPNSGDLVRYGHCLTCGKKRKKYPL